MAYLCITVRKQCSDALWFPAKQEKLSDITLCRTVQCYSTSYWCVLSIESDEISFQFQSKSQDHLKQLWLEYVNKVTSEGQSTLLPSCMNSP